MHQVRAFLKTLFWPERRDLATVNRYFLPLIIAAGGLIGSGLSSLLIGGVILACVQIMRGVVSVPQQPTIRAAAFCFALLFAAELMAELVNFNGWNSFIETAENLPFLGFLPLYAVIIARRDDIRANIEKMAMAAGILVCAFAIMQFQFFGVRALGGAGNAGVFAVMCVLLVAVNFLTMLRHHGVMRTLGGFALLAAGGALILSGMRSLWPTMIILPCLILLIYGRFVHLRISKRFVCASLVLLIAAAFALYQPVHDRIALGMYDFGQLAGKNYTTSLGQRVAIWEAGRELVAESPLIGHGGAQSKRLLSEKTKELTGAPLYASHFHNSLLTYWVRSGLLGVLALGLIFIVPLVRASRALEDEQSFYGFALLVSLELTYIISGLFGLALGHDIMDTVFVGTLAIALYMVFGREREIPS